MGLPAGHKGDARRGAGRFGVHPREPHAFISEFIDIRSFVSANSVQISVTEIPEADIVDQDVKNVRWLAVVLLPELGQFCIDFLIVGSPFFAILGLKDIVLGIVDDLVCRCAELVPNSNAIIIKTENK